MTTPSPWPGARPPVGRLHVLTDVALQSRFSHLDLTRAALRGGADVVQLRDKAASDEALRPTAEAFVGACHEAGRVALIDDRAGLVAQVGATGVHVGEHDLPADQARAVVGPGALVGATANDLPRVQALVAARVPVDYLGVGPVFGTTSKASPAATLGLDGLAALVEASPWPVIAIGSITADRVADVLATGAHGIAVLGAVCLADDPAAATATLRHALDGVVDG